MHKGACEEWALHGTKQAACAVLAAERVLFWGGRRKREASGRLLCCFGNGPVRQRRAGETKRKKGVLQSYRHRWDCKC